jgi:hypothetical protein
MDMSMLHTSIDVHTRKLAPISLHTRTHAHSRVMLVSLTVGKVDAGVAVLLTEDKRLVCSLPPIRIPVCKMLVNGSLSLVDRIPLHPPPA